LSERFIRSFVAVDVDDKAILNRIVDCQRRMTETGADLKLVEPENIHITLRFLGEAPSSVVERIYSELKGISFSPFDVEFKGLGAFPDLHRLNVVWIGVKRGEKELNEIFNQLEPKVRALGFQPDKKGFSAHMTIARVKSGRNKEKLVRFIQDMRDAEFGVMKVYFIRLKKSVLTPRGPVYSTLYEVKSHEGI
jgi:2'-5' RNA ligase